MINNGISVSNLGDILVVEDTSASLKYLAGILTTAGYHVRPASDGELALRSIEMKHPDLILLDIIMPGINGIEVCRQLKNNPETNQIPIIFISAMGESELKVKALEAGAVDYIIKPFVQAEILVRIKIHLNLYKLQQTLTRRTQELVSEIKEHKQAEKKVADAARKWQTTFDAISDPVCIIDMDGNIIQYNSATVKLLDIEEKDIKGKHCWKLLHNRDEPSGDCLLNRMKITKSQETEIFVVKDRWLEASVDPIFNADGQINEAVYIIRDITEYRQALDDLKEHRDHLEELVNERTQKLEEKNAEMEALNLVYVGREFRINELRQEIKAMKKEYHVKDS
ncbi:MAG: response regulator [Candidatus Stygibacter frigidus]|nr:response regulator [Candidatus Stygibacter frigidus]